MLQRDVVTTVTDLRELLEGFVEIVYKLSLGLVENGIWRNGKEDADAAKVSSFS